jgi:hypothetical protein
MICMQDVADKHRAVAAAADDLQAVVAELNAVHIGRVPRHRALWIEFELPCRQKLFFFADATASACVTDCANLHRNGRISAHKMYTKKQK